LFVVAAQACAAGYEAPPGTSSTGGAAVIATAAATAESRAATPAVEAVPPTFVVDTEIRDALFEPEITISAGAAVRWTNRDAALHGITAKGGGSDSGLLARGDSYSKTFAEPGRFEYLCVLHRTMTGVVIVE
jgi:plastocyanin